MSERCSATTKAGKSCSWSAEFGSLCRGHAAQAGDEDARLLQVNAGRRSAIARRIDLKTPADVRALLERAAVLASSKNEERHARAATLTAIARTAASLIERDLESLAQRLARLSEGDRG